MFGNTIQILPLGILFPVTFLLLFILYFSVGEGVRAKIGGRLRAGTTEYPTEASMCLNNELNNRVEFTKHGDSLILILDKPWLKSISTTAELKDC